MRKFRHWCAKRLHQLANRIDPHNVDFMNAKVVYDKTNKLIKFKNSNFTKSMADDIKKELENTRDHCFYVIENSKYSDPRWICRFHNKPSRHNVSAGWDKLCLEKDPIIEEDS